MKKKELLSIAFAVTFILGRLLPGITALGVGFSEGEAGNVFIRHAAVSASGFPSPADAALLKGKFLVASRNIRDPRFSETVILLLQYGVGGAMGLIISKPTGVKLSEVFPEMKGLKGRADTVYDGGPVDRNQLFLLMRSGSQPTDSLQIFGDVYASSSLAALEQMIGRSGKKEKFRLYVGYAGWAAGQLDREVSRGDWHVLQADADTIFDKKSSEIWPELFRRSSAQWVRGNGYQNSLPPLI
jgi:putative transcriptional regulator